MHFMLSIRLALAELAVLLLSTLASTVHAQALPACEFTRGVPRDSQSAEFTARTATAITAQEAIVQTEGPLYATAFRPALTSFPSKARVQLARLDAQGTELAGCDSGWFSTGTIVTILTPDPPLGVHKWRVRIFDDASGGPTGEAPYLVQLSLHGGPAFKAAENFPRETKFDGGGSEPTATCGHAIASLRPGTTLELAAQSQTTLPPTASGLIYTYGGRRLYVSVTATRDVQVDVKIYAKEGGGRAFSGICTTRIDATSSNSAYVVGTIPWDRLDGAIWRVELSPVSTANTAHAVAVGAKVLREHYPLASEALASASDDKKLRYTFELLSECYQCRATFRRIARPSRGQPRTAPPPEPTVVRPLPTALDLRTESALTDSESQALLRGLRAAIGVWIANCSTCNFDVLSVIRVNGVLWARTDFVDPLMPDVKLKGLTDTVGQRLAFNRMIARTMTAVSGNELYQRVDSESVSSLPVCAPDVPTSVEPLQRVQRALGCITAGPIPAIVKLTLAVRRDGATACGSSSNDIACEADSGLLEFNGRDYALCLAAVQEQCIGDGARKIDLLHVLMHEVGHWLKIGHVDMPNAMMASTLDQSRCISDHDLAALRAVLTATTELPQPTRQAFRLMKNPPR